MAKNSKSHYKVQSAALQNDWPTWPMLNQQEVLAARAAKKPRRLNRGIIFKFHKVTWRRAQNILWAAKHNTNLVSAILENLREDPFVYRDDGAFESIHQLLLEHAERLEAGQKSGFHLRKLTTILEERFASPDDMPPETQDSSHSSPSASTVRIRPQQRTLDPKEFPIVWTLRRGAFAQAALPLLLFHIQIQKYLSG